MNKFYVWPAWYPDDEAIDGAEVIEAGDAQAAAECMVGSDHARFDHSPECMVCVLESGGAVRDKATFAVRVVESVDFYAEPMESSDAT